MAPIIRQLLLFPLCISMLLAFESFRPVTAQFSLDSETLRTRYKKEWDLVSSLGDEAAFASYDGTQTNEARVLTHITGSWDSGGLNDWLWARVSNLSANSKHVVTSTFQGQHILINTRGQSFLCSPGIAIGSYTHFPYSEVVINGTKKIAFNEAFDLENLPPSNVSDCLTAAPVGVNVASAVAQRQNLIETAESTVNGLMTFFGENFWKNLLTLNSRVGECQVFGYGDNPEAWSTPISLGFKTPGSQLCENPIGELLNLYVNGTPGTLSGLKVLLQANSMTYST